MEGEGQGEGVTVEVVGTVTGSDISCPPQDAAASPRESSNDTVSHMQSSQSDPSQSAAHPSTEILHDKIVKQVEYYFSAENLATDKYMMSRIKKDKEGFVTVGLVASFRKMKKLTEDISEIVAALRKSSLLIVSEDGKKVKRLHPLPISEALDPKLCTVRMDNLPDGHSAQSLKILFGQVGNIKNISIFEPPASEGGTDSKLHALVEYETVEAAEKAVSAFSDKEDWRNGLRVKLLKQAAVKSENRRKARKDPVGDAQVDDVSSPADDSVHDGTDKNIHKIQGKGRSRTQKYRAGVAAPNYIGEVVKLPPPGPRMPDGTRGFAVGRGRPPPPDTSIL